MIQYIRDIFETAKVTRRPVVSFEFFPTKTEDGERVLLERTIPALHPVTFDLSYNLVSTVISNSGFDIISGTNAPGTTNTFDFEAHAGSIAYFHLLQTSYGAELDIRAPSGESIGAFGLSRDPGAVLLRESGMFRGQIHATNDGETPYAFAAASR